MKNKDLIKVVKSSFHKYLEKGPRSTEKLKVLHGKIAEDIQSRLDNGYSVHSLGFKDGKEIPMKGIYYDKKVDIVIKKEDEVLAGIGVKFIMSNYSQNSNNYFENLLGETANIRISGKPYYQILILRSKSPYFNSDGILSKYELLSEHNLKKYLELSKDDINKHKHVPNKMLLFIVDISDNPDIGTTKTDYKEYYEKRVFDFSMNKNKYEFGKTFIHNDYDKFITEILDEIKK